MRRYLFSSIFWKRGGKWILFVMGVLLLALISPKSTPWTMRCLAVNDRVSDMLCILAVLGILCMAGFPLSNRKVLLFLRHHRRRFIWFCVGLLGFAVTLFSLAGRNPIGLTVEEPPVLLYSARPLVLYAVLGGIAILLMLPALLPRLEILGGKILSQGKAAPTWLFSVCLFLFFFLAANIFSWTLFEHIPHVQDSITQVFHGKILASGHVSVPAHLYNVFFDFGHMINKDCFYSMYPFGHVAWMALGAWIRAPWMINPLLGALTVLLLYRLGKAMYGEQTGRIAAILGCVAPFMVFMSSEFMSHVSALFCLALFMLGYVYSVERRSLPWAVLAGASMGMALNTRLLTALGIGLPFGIHAVCITFSVGDFRRYFKIFAVMTGVTVVFGLLMLVFNYATTGDPFVVGYEVIWGRNHHPGFGESIDGIVHTPRAGLEHLLANLNALNVYLFEWPIPGLIFMFVPICLALKNRWDRLLLASFGCLALVYFFYWFNDWCFGPRFMYEASAAAVLLTARGLRLLPVLFRKVFGIRTSQRRVFRISAGCVMLMVLYGWCINVPAFIRLYACDYWCVNRDVLNAVEEKGISNAVVYVSSYYACAFPENDPSLDGDIIYVKDKRENNRLMMTFYPDRKHYTAYMSEIHEMPPVRSGVVMGMERTPFFRAVADRLGWSYTEYWLKPWGLIEMEPEHPQADGLVFDGHTHAWEPNPVEQWADAMVRRAKNFIQTGNWEEAEQTVNRLTTVWPEYVPGLNLGLKLAEHSNNERAVSEMRERLRLYAEPDVHTNVVFQNGIVFRGMRVESKPCMPGGELTVTLFWHVPRNVTMRNWAVSLKLKDASRKTYAGNDSILGSDEQQTRQTDQEDYVEIRRMTLPLEMPSDEYAVHLALRDGHPPFRSLIIPGCFPGIGRKELAIAIDLPGNPQ